MYSGARSSVFGKGGVIEEKLADNFAKRECMVVFILMLPIKMTSKGNLANHNYRLVLNEHYENKCCDIMQLDVA